MSISPKSMHSATKRDERVGATPVVPTWAIWVGTTDTMKDPTELHNCRKSEPSASSNRKGTMHIQVKELHPSIQAALKGRRCGKKDIEVIPASEVEANSSSWSDGYRGFLIGINLDTGEQVGRYGSWGGANPWEHREVDLTTQKLPVPINGCFVKGSTGPKTFARVYVNPTWMAQMLPAVDETTDEEQQALYCFTSIKGGQYRKDELRRRKVRTETVESLVERGYLVRNKAGSIQATTKGKNARDRSRVSY
jgi:hypothetical protein